MKIFDRQAQEINDLLEAIGGYTSHIFREAKKGSKPKATQPTTTPTEPLMDQPEFIEAGLKAIDPDMTLSIKDRENLTRGLAKQFDRFIQTNNRMPKAADVDAVAQNIIQTRQQATAPKAAPSAPVAPQAAEVPQEQPPVAATAPKAKGASKPKGTGKAQAVAPQVAEPEAPAQSPRQAPPEYLIPPQLDAEKELAAKAKLAATEREYRAMFKKAGMSPDEIEANVAQELDRVRKMDADVDAYISGLNNPSAPEAPTEPVQEPTTEPEAPVADEPAAVTEPEVGPETRNRLQALAGIEPTASEPEPTEPEAVPTPAEPVVEPTIAPTEVPAEVPAVAPTALGGNARAAQRRANRDAKAVAGPSQEQPKGQTGGTPPDTSLTHIMRRANKDKAPSGNSMGSDQQLDFDFGTPTPRGASTDDPDQLGLDFDAPATPKEPTKAEPTGSPEEPAQDSPSTDASGDQQPWQNPKPHTTKKSYGLRDKIKAAASAFKDPGSVGDTQQSSGDRQFAKRWKELWERLQNEGVLDENLTADELTYIFTETQVGQTLTEQYMAEENINEERYSIEEWVGMMEEAGVVDEGWGKNALAGLSMAAGLVGADRLHNPGPQDTPPAATVQAVAPTSKDPLGIHARNAKQDTILNVGKDGKGPIKSPTDHNTWIANYNSPKESYTLEEWMGMMNELSPETLASYSQKSSAQQSAIKNKYHGTTSPSTGQTYNKDMIGLPPEATQAGDVRTYGKRRTGVAQANRNLSAQISKAYAAKKPSAQIDAMPKPNYDNDNFPSQGFGSADSQRKVALRNPKAPKLEESIDTDRLQRLAGIKPLHD